ncbi:MAG TPA: histidine kinase [Gemmatimonadaceae bacterium]|nr:histidine kinase [Gemmatimonadaceae bacterium]
MIARTSRYWVTVVLAGFAIYTAIAVLGALSALTYFGATHTVIDWRGYIANRFLEQYTCALFVAPLFWLVDRYPLVPRDWKRHVGVFVIAIVTFIAVKYAIMLPLYRWWSGETPATYWLALVDNAVPVSFDFLAIVGVAHALRYYREVQERERAAGELTTQLVQARLDALRGQLHPHFLFNTLNAAATLMHENVAAADDMLTQLGSLLRISLERTESEVTLERELELADRYLAIMRYRFSDRLSVAVNVSDDARLALVPPFITQPLLENALEHGIARRRGAGSIDIVARRDDGALEVTIADDGAGLSASAGNGIGLANTRARLTQLYGARGGLELSASDSGRGARAAIRIPYRTFPAVSSCDAS